MTDPAADPSALYARASALQARGDLVEAERVLRDVLAQAPLHVDALKAIADCLRRQGRGAEADAAAGLADNAAVAQTLRAAAALQGSPIEAKAEALLRKLVAQFPARAEPHAALIDWLRRAGQWRQAWQATKAALSLAGDHPALRHRLEAFEGDLAPRSGEESVPVPFRMIDDFLDADRHAELLAFTEQARELLGRSRIGMAPLADGLDEEMRRSRTVRMTDSIQSWLEPLVRRAAGGFYRGLGMAANPSGRVEMEFTAHNDGDFYRHHQDHGLDTHYALRRVSYVYYFHRAPRGFSGGDLALYDRGVPVDMPLLGRFTRLPAEDNRLILFPSHAWHEVLKVSCPSQAYEDSRFTIVGWVLADPTRLE